jgi:hypothetical protein
MVAVVGDALIAFGICPVVSNVAVEVTASFTKLSLAVRLSSEVLGTDGGGGGGGLGGAGGGGGVGVEATPPPPPSPQADRVAKANNATDALRRIFIRHPQPKILGSGI